MLLYISIVFVGYPLLAGVSRAMGLTGDNQPED